VLGLRNSQTDNTGTKVLDSRYDPTIAKPTAKASGTNRLCAAPVMKKAGMNTARIQSMATKRGSVVSAVASLAARARLRPSARRVWMFSMVTVASSTRMPTANANPPKVMTLIVWPESQSAVTEARIASGMFKTTMSELRQSRRNSSTITPVSTAPSAPSTNRPWMARVT